MVYVVGAVMRIVYPLPAEGELVVLAILRPLLLHARQPRVQPVRGSCNIVTGLMLVRKNGAKI
jgi:hypothetical protein